MKPFISVVVPLLNEERTIERLARSLLDQDYPADRYEIIMADGGSTDRTREVLATLDRSGRIRVLENPGRTAPAALNIALSHALGEIITRVDGHSRVAPDYLSRVVAVMEETGEAAVGGPVLMEADNPFRRALVQALYSRFAVGSVPYRTLRERAFVESLQTGSFRREVFDRVGPFDESLAVVEDLDMNTRIRKAGFRLLLDPSIRFWYSPRPGLRALWRQIWRVGYVKALVLRKHPDIFKPKYILPSGLLAVIVFATLLTASPLAGAPPVAGRAGLGVLGFYAACIVVFACSRIPQAGLDAWRLLAIVPVLHVGYGMGFLAGALRLLRGWRPAVP